MSYTAYPSYTTLPPQTGQSGKVLSTDGTDLSWLATGGVGTVTSVGLTLPGVFAIAGTNPIVGAGTFTVTANVQTANTVWAGPASGADAAPTFRSLTPLDLPSFKADWANATGTTKTVTHNLNSTDVLVQVYDLSTNAQLPIGASLLSVVTTSANVVTLTSAAPPTTNWRVLILAI